MQTEVSVNMSVGDVMAALTAGQESGRLPELREDTTVAEQLKALAWDSLNVRVHILSSTPLMHASGAGAECMKCCGQVTCSVHGLDRAVSDCFCQAGLAPGPAVWHTVVIYGFVIACDARENSGRARHPITAIVMSILCVC
jgi:hypothetical protein